jgi:putative PIN family toxin of toxin-antitoxin system
LIKVVLDANVLGPGLVLASGSRADIVRAWLEEAYELITSEHVIGEVVTTWNQTYWRQRTLADALLVGLRLLREESTLVIPVDGVENVAAHRQDDIVIATAIAGNAEYLVTGDKELLRLKSHKTVSIISPQEFLEILEAKSDDSDA